MRSSLVAVLTVAAMAGGTGALLAAGGGAGGGGAAESEYRPDRHEKHVGQIGFSPERNNRYAYHLAKNPPPNNPPGNSPPGNSPPGNHH